MNDNFNVQELLDKIARNLLANDPQLTEEGACEKAKSLLKGLTDGGAEKISEFADAVGRGEYELPNGSLLQVGPPEEKKMNISPETQEKLDKVLAKVDELIPPVETVRLKLTRAETTVFDSKMGGVPYLPKGMEYPTVRKGEHAGKPLYFLAQLNFGKLPKIEGFPTGGILQFFAGCDYDEDYSIGSDYDDRCNQNEFRVIYHESVTADENALCAAEDMPEFEEEEPYFPVKGELLLTAEKPEKVPVTSSDIHFEGAFVKAYNAASGTEFGSIWGKDGIFDADEDFCNAAFEARNLQGTRIGGFPFFMQGEPRERYPDHTILLFQSDSEGTCVDGAWEDWVSWGDSGVANFFITSEDLEKRDFSKVLYNWDCG